MVVPDLPLELTHEIREACGKEGIELTLLVTPTTPKERMREIAKYTQGFVYLISVTGVTGIRAELNQKLQSLIEMLHDTTEKSVTTAVDGYTVRADLSVSMAACRFLWVLVFRRPSMQNSYENGAPMAS